MCLRIDRSNIHRKQLTLGGRSPMNPAADGADGKGQPEPGEESDNADEQIELHGRPQLGGAAGDQQGDD